MYWKGLCKGLNAIYQPKNTLYAPLFLRLLYKSLKSA